jgi:hypothetical protein
MSVGTNLGLTEDLLIAETRPTPSPAKKRPAMNRGCDVDAVCRMTPKLKTKPIAVKRPILRPRISAHGAARSAPKKVPAERIDTMSESSLAVSFPSGCVEKDLNQYFMPRIPEIVPVSYPNRTPPKATKSPTRMAGLCASVSQWCYNRDVNSLPCGTSRAWRWLERDLDHDVYKGSMDRRCPSREDRSACGGWNKTAHLGSLSSSPAHKVSPSSPRKANSASLPKHTRRIVSSSTSLVPRTWRTHLAPRLHGRVPAREPVMHSSWIGPFPRSGMPDPLHHLRGRTRDVQVSFVPL